MSNRVPFPSGARGPGLRRPVRAPRRAERRAAAGPRERPPPGPTPPRPAPARGGAAPPPGRAPAPGPHRGGLQRQHRDRPRGARRHRRHLAARRRPDHQPGRADRRRPAARPAPPRRRRVPGADGRPPHRPGRPTSCSLTFSGKLPAREASGAYRQEENGDWYVFTQFEATDARRAFPCFDEPSFKIPWQLTLEVPRRATGLRQHPPGLRDRRAAT